MFAGSGIRSCRMREARLQSVQLSRAAHERKDLDRLYWLHLRKVGKKLGVFK